MQQSLSWKANSLSASQEIPCLLWHPKVHCLVYKSLPPVQVLSHMHSVHTFPLYFPKIHLVCKTLTNTIHAAILKPQSTYTSFWFCSSDTKVTAYGLMGGILFPAEGLYVFFAPPQFFWGSQSQLPVLWVSEIFLMRQDSPYEV
jgi:hypothetical protein